MLDSIKLQIESIRAEKRNEIFFVERERYQQVDGRAVKKTVRSKPKRWWWQDQNGAFLTELRFGTHLIEIESGKPSILCGHSLEDVVAVLEKLSGAVSRGELDTQIAAARAKAQRKPGR